jgi:hypothetical protein
MLAHYSICSFIATYVCLPATQFPFKPTDIELNRCQHFSSYYGIYSFCHITTVCVPAVKMRKLLFLGILLTNH